ncbi:acylneuraminate cytidylyltransferase family protein [Pedobacter sp. MW01-1-1]|uniref:acylneuraminate cytidylyltransferase family protein n=1 Tax=Pedobacter sp. MW01-1-1 TaxID=3383027 RepID=UPI003FF0132E
MERQTITAVIPVRAGSRRLKNKNIAPFGGTNLLLYKIGQLKRVPLIDSIVVSSDSDDMLQMAAEENTLTHKRGIEYCDEQTKTFGEVVRHICESITGDHVLWATCTAPLIFPNVYQEAIKLYFDALDNGFDSLVSVEPFKRYLWDDNGPVNYEFGLKHVPSQQLPTLYFVTDGILIAPREKMIEWSYFHGANPLKFPLEKRLCVDIDDELDMLKARAWIDYDVSVTSKNPYFVNQ